MTPGEMADRLEAMSISFADLDTAAAMLREAERLLLSAEPTYRTEHIRAEWAIRRKAWLEGGTA